MDLSMPSTVSQSPPGELYKPRQYVYDHWPSLAELLPKWRGRPGFVYFQCCTSNLRRAQDEGWVEVDNTVIYTIEGPKGSVDLKLLCRGKMIPGQPHNSGARLCYGDKTGEELTGLYINPHLHANEVSAKNSNDSENLEAPKGGDTQTSVKTKGTTDAEK